MKEENMKPLAKGDHTTIHDMVDHMVKSLATNEEALSCECCFTDHKSGKTYTITLYEGDMVEENDE